jgi:hypothetical protein
VYRIVPKTWLGAIRYGVIRKLCLDLRETWFGQERDPNGKKRGQQCGFSHRYDPFWCLINASKLQAFSTSSRTPLAAVIRGSVAAAIIRNTTCR